MIKINNRKLAKFLGFDLIEFSLSNSTTLEDLFCKEIPIQEGDKIKFLTIFCAC